MDTDNDTEPLKVFFNSEVYPKNEWLTYLWTFGDGDTSNEPFPVHVYLSNGTYYPKLEIFDTSQVLLASHSKGLTVKDSWPHADFIAIASETSSFTFQFDSKSFSYDPITQYSWHFGDDDYIMGQNHENVVHTYDQEGKYSVSLTVYDSDGSFDTKFQTIFVENNDPVIADFILETSNCDQDKCIEPVEIKCTQTISHSTEIDYYWEINDIANYPMNQSLNTTVESEGTYSIKLIVYDKSSGQECQTSKTIIVENRTEKNVCQDSSKCFYSSIQNAIEKSLDGDTIIVWPGRYIEKINYQKKNIDIVSKGSPEDTIIDGALHGPVVSITDISKYRHPQLKGFTIINGSSEDGGGIVISNASPMVKECIFQKNDADNGGGVYITGISSPQFLSCTIISNQANKGGGIYIESGTQIIIDQCKIQNNLAVKKGGGFYGNNAQIFITKSHLLQNTALQYGGGFMIEKQANLDMLQSYITGNSSKIYGGAGFISKSSQMTLKSCLITYNSAKYEGGLFFVNGALSLVNITSAQNSDNQECSIYSEDGQINIQNSILWNHEKEICQTGYSQLSIKSSDLWQTTFSGQGNFHDDPLFIDPAFNFSLSADSPCLTPGIQDDAPNEDIDGKQWPDGKVNIGAYINNFYEPGNNAPLVYLKASPLQAYILSPIQFIDQSIPEKNHYIVERIWDFGDGTITQQTDKNIVHSYTQAGQYSISLMVMDNQGLTASKTFSQYITIKPYDLNPTAQFDTDKITEYVNRPIQFTDRSIPKNGALVEWKWSFGDGHVSNAQHPVHSYTQTGQYTIQLSVKNEFGWDHCSKRNYLTINDVIPSASFRAHQTVGVQELVVQFVNESSAPNFVPITTQFWDFGDGSPLSYDKNPVHWYESPGIYSVTLTVQSIEGQSIQKRQDYINILNQPKEWTVCLQGCDFVSIKSAIDRSNDGDQILVDDGTYFEHIDFKGKAITVFSNNGPNNTTLIGQMDTSMVIFQNNENESSVLQGFTLQNGSADYGGGIFIKNASPLIKDCIIRNNHANMNGGGMYITTNSSPRIENVIIENNTSKGNGGGIYCTDLSKTIAIQSEIINNTAEQKGGGIMVSGYDDEMISKADLSKVLIDSNKANLSGGGIYAEWAGMFIDNSFIVRNQAENIDGIDIFHSNVELLNDTIAKNGFPGGTGFQAEFSVYKITNTIVWDNGKTNIANINSLSQVTYSDIQGFPESETNFQVDPLFIQPDDGNFHLSNNSDCQNKGTDTTILYDYDGDPRPIDGQFDVGADEIFLSGNKPLAYFLWTPRFPKETDLIKFQVTARQLEQDNAMYFWNFGDGNYSFNPIHIHRFSNDGSYTVSLTVTDSDGQTASVQKTLVVTDTKPIANFAINKDVGIEPFDAQFMNFSVSNDLKGYTWIFGDDGISHEKHPIHTYVTPGKYTIWLIVEETDGDMARKINTITIKPSIRTVCLTGCQYSSIQEAINESCDNGIIHVNPGTYFEHINYSGKNLNILATNGATETIIDGSQSIGSVVQFSHNETPKSILDGFFITNGHASSGAGIYIENASPIIRNCIIENNQSDMNGGGIFIISDASPVIEKVIIQNNQSIANGGGLYCEQSHVTINRSVIKNNTAWNNGGGFFCNGLDENTKCKANLSRTMIDQNIANQSGGGIYATWAIVNIDNSYIVRNQGLTIDGIEMVNAEFTLIFDTIAHNGFPDGIDIQADSSEYTLLNTIVWNDNPTNIKNINSLSKICYSDISTSYHSENNINEDPLFMNPEQGNFHLNDNSSCLNKGKNIDYHYDYDGNYRPADGKYDIGADEIKANTLPTAKWLVHYDDTTEPLRIAITNQSTPVEEIESYQLTFSDGSEDIIMKSWPESSRKYHTYTQQGTYVVSLTVTEFDGDSDTVSLTITAIDSLPCAQFTWRPSEPDEKEIINFEINDRPYDRDNATYQWSFGDGAYQTGPFPWHTYSTEGQYTVTLTVSDSDGQTDTVQHIIEIEDTHPTANFNISEYEGVEPFYVQFINFSTTNELKGYTWIFGDGEISNETNPSHIYTKPGTHTVWLILEEMDGSIARQIKTITIIPGKRKVCLSGCQYTSIQDAINESCDGGTIQVAPGRYFEHLQFLGKKITLTALKGATETIIDGSQLFGSTVQFIQNESKETVLNGFTITNGKADSGGGLYIYNASPTLKNCNIVSNSAEKGGGVYIANQSSPLFMNCTIVDNTAKLSGGGLYCSNNCHISVQDSRIQNNQSSVYGGGLSLFDHSSIKIEYAVINHNHSSNGGGIYESNSNVDIMNCLIHHNTAGESGGMMMALKGELIIHSSTITQNSSNEMIGGIYSDTSTITIINSILWNNQTDFYEANQGSHDDQIVYSIIQSIPGQGNSPDDPLFIDPETNFQLKSDSPAIDKGTDHYAPQEDIDHNDRPLNYKFDMGAYESDNSKPVVNFKANQKTIFVGDEIQLTSQTTSKDQIVLLQWDFGDGQSGQGEMIRHTYALPGLYHIGLTATENDGDQAVHVKYSYITVKGNIPEAQFVASSYIGFVPLHINFQDTSRQGSSPISSWYWTFGDGYSSTEQHPVHTFEKPGKYSVTLMVWNEYGQSTFTQENIITAFDTSPIAKMSIHPSMGQNPLKVKFKNISIIAEGNLNNIDWDFGDGQTCMTEICEHIYENPGAYTVTMTISSDGGSTSITRVDGVRVLHSPKTIYVCQDLSICDENSIQEAINAANDYDQIIVKKGIYYEHINFSGKAIRVESEDGPVETIIDGGYTNQNISLVSFKNQESVQSILGGFTLQNGTSINGAGISIMGSSPDIRNCIIQSNKAIETGGGIFMDLSSNPTIYGCTITKNLASKGAGIACLQSSNPDIMNTAIQNNTADKQGGGIYTGLSSQLILRDSLIHNNHSQIGGGIFGLKSFPVLYQTTCSNNYASSNGGGIALFDVFGVQFNQSIIQENNARISGGGIYINNGMHIDIVNCLITDNQASNGGGLYYTDVIHPLVSFSTIANNTASQKGNGFYGGEVSGEKPIFQNSIIWNNGNDIYTMATHSISMIHSIIEDETYSGEGVIHLNPLFIDKKNNNYCLQSFSPCIGSGKNINQIAIDILGNARSIAIDTPPDMGAYEHELDTPIDPLEAIDFNDSNNNRNDTPEMASPVVSNQIYSFDSSQDVDWFSFCAKAGTMVDLTLTQLDNIPNTLMEIYFLNQSGELEIINLSHRQRKTRIFLNKDWVSIEITQSGIYYIKVYQSIPNGDGHYQIEKNIKGYDYKSALVQLKVEGSRELWSCQENLLVDVFSPDHSASVHRIGKTTHYWVNVIDNNLLLTINSDNYQPYTYEQLIQNRNYQEVEIQLNPTTIRILKEAVIISQILAGFSDQCMKRKVEMMDLIRLLKALGSF